jgi:hypothetical protein
MEGRKKQVIGIELEDLTELIQYAIRTEIESCIKDNRFGTEFKDEVLDRKSAADFLKISPEKITDLYNKQELPGKKLGREYFFLRSQLTGLFKKVKHSKTC